MTVERIVDKLLEAGLKNADRLREALRRKKPEAPVDPDLADAEEFYRTFMSGVHVGEKIGGAGGLALYTYDWPEYVRWHDNSYSTQGGASPHPDETWSEWTCGDVMYEGRKLYLPGIKGNFCWQIHWEYNSSSDYTRRVTVNFEHWDRGNERIWKSHHVKPLMYDYKKRIPGQPDHPYPKTRADWDDLNPAMFDAMELDAAMKEKLVRGAEKFLAKLAKVAVIDKIVWHVGEINATPVQEDKKSTEGWEQISGDFGSPWDYGGTWYNAKLDELLHFPGVEGDKDTDSRLPVIDSKLTPYHYRAIIDKLHLDDQMAWENTEDEIRTEIASQMDAAKKFPYYRVVVDDNEWIERDYAKEIAEIKVEQELTDETWAALPPAQKEASLADRMGWHEFDLYPEKITRTELSVLLGIDL